MIRDGSVKVKMDEDLTILLYNINYLRRKHCLSREEMAALIGISPDSIDAIEKGYVPRDLRAKEIILMAMDFHIPIDTIMHQRLDT